MKLIKRFRFHRHSKTTEFISLNTKVCIACGDCVETCQRGVLGMVAIFNHKHARIKNPDLCKGCFLCVKACDQNAIQSLVQEGLEAALRPF